MIKSFNLSIFLMIFSFFYTSAQKMECISTSVSSDSSLYDICKVNDNEYWICGENGILKSIDSSANIKTIEYKNKGKSLYRMIKSGKYIYIAADHGTIYKFDSENHLLERVFTSEKYRNHCFYDFKILENGKLIVCGGKSEIIKAEYTMPCGFIIELDTSFSIPPRVLWKSKINFVWSLTQNSQRIVASAYNGRISKILTADKGKMKFKKEYKIKALVYMVQMQGNTLWFSGSSNIHFRQDGIIGKINNDTVNLDIISGKGCIWNMIVAKDSVLAFADNGDMLIYYSDKWITNKIKPKKTIYASQQINSNSILMVGNGKTILLLKK